MPIYRLNSRNIATGRFIKLTLNIVLLYDTIFITNAFRVEGKKLSFTRLVSRKGLKADLTLV